MAPEVREITNRLRSDKRFWLFLRGGVAFFVVAIFLHAGVAFIGSGVLFFVGGMFNWPPGLRPCQRRQSSGTARDRIGGIGSAAGSGPFTRQDQPSTLHACGASWAGSH